MGTREAGIIKDFRITLTNVSTLRGWSSIHPLYLLSAGCASLVLYELDEFEARVEETVDAVGETRLFGTREAV